MGRLTTFQVRVVFRVGEVLVVLGLAWFTGWAVAVESGASNHRGYWIAPSFVAAILVVVGLALVLFATERMEDDKKPAASPEPSAPPSNPMDESIRRAVAQRPVPPDKTVLTSGFGITQQVPLALSGGKRVVEPSSDDAETLRILGAVQKGDFTIMRGGAPLSDDEIAAAVQRSDKARWDKLYDQGEANAEGAMQAAAETLKERLRSSEKARARAVELRAEGLRIVALPKGSPDPDDPAHVAIRAFVNNAKAFLGDDLYRQTQAVVFTRQNSFRSRMKRVVDLLSRALDATA